MAIKPALLALVLCCASAAHAADTAADIAASAVELKDGSGFDVVGQAIGDARIVMLGEPWHGDGAAIAERTKLIRYLHEKMDFDVLVLEADFYALHHAWEQAGKDKRFSELAARNVYSFWSTSEVSKPLWRYVDAQLQGDDPLIVAGIDPKTIGELSRTRLPIELQSRAQESGVPPREAESASHTLARLLEPGTRTPPVTDDEVGLLVQLIHKLADAGVRDTGFRGQLALSLKRNVDGADRDPAMAENLIWLATRMYPDKKLIVWAHNNHALLDKWALFDGDGLVVARLRDDMTPEALGRKTYLGEATRHYFGRDAVYSIATISRAGSYSSDIRPALDGQRADFGILAQLEPAPSGTLESAMHEAGHAIAFADLRPFRSATAKVSSRVIDYTQLPALPLRLWDGYDGVLYLDRTYGLNETP